MKRPAGRRAVLIAAGTAAVAVAARPAAVQAAELRGSVVFEGGAAIPEGRLEIYLEDPAIQDKARRRAAETRIESDGKSKAVSFSLTPPAGWATSPTRRIVARLERADGWLLARGSAPASASSPVQVALGAVMY
jgi:hypothetical protein